MKYQAGIIPVAKISAHPSNIGRDLGDLRELVTSVTERGVLVPVVLERHGELYRLRDGHRRTAAARIAKVTSVPAIIHAEELDETDWLLESVEYNEQRKGFSPDDRKRVATRLLELGVTRAGVARAFGITTPRLAEVVDGPKPTPARAPRPPSSISLKTLRVLRDRWQTADRDTILAELEHLLEPVTPGGVSGELKARAGRYSRDGESS